MAPASSYGSTPAGVDADAAPASDPEWVSVVKRVTGAAPATAERLDVLKYLLVVLVVAAQFSEPFYHVDNKPAACFIFFAYQFAGPGFVLISGYVSNDLNARRRRALIAGVIFPFLVLHFLYSAWYTEAFCRGDDAETCQITYNYSMIDPAAGKWNSWGKDWTFAYPFGNLWYLMALLQMRAWRQFALEMRAPIMFHVALALLVGYAAIGEYLALQRVFKFTPYFLTGFLMKKHGAFFPVARGDAAVFTCVGALLLNVGLACVAGTQMSYSTGGEKILSGKYPYDDTYGNYWPYGAFYQLGLYAWSFGAMAIVFALVRDQSDYGVKYSSGDAGSTKDAGFTKMHDGKSEEESLLGGAVKSKLRAYDQGVGARGGRSKAAARYARESEQSKYAINARSYLRAAKYGSRSFYPFCLHTAVFLFLAHATGWYDVCEKYSGGHGAVHLRFFFSVVMAFIVATGLSLKPVVYVARHVLEPNLSFIFGKEEKHEA